MAVQNALLLRIIRENKSTLYGRQHKFENINNYVDFSRQVPVREYEALRSFVDAEIERSEKALTCELPLRYARTSGTSGKPKDIPITASYLKALRRIQQTAVAYQHQACPEAFSGSILAITSPANEGVLSNGKSFGSASGTVADNTPAPVREKFIPLAAALTVQDSRVKYLLILRLALARRDITYVCTANPTTMLTLIKLYREHESLIIDDLQTGKFFLADKVPPAAWSVIEPYITACPQRAAELSRSRATSEERRIADLWPTLHLVVTWTGGSAGIAVEALRRELSPRTRILELGYLSSEVHATFTIGRRAQTGMPTFDTYFFEFAEREKWDRGEQECLTMDRLRKNVDYYVIVTTPSGLYRYFMNDVVRVTGFLRRTPLLKFVQKGKGVTNITGEKLYEAQVLTAVRVAMEEAGYATRFVMMLADEQAYRYRLYVEADVMPALVATAFAKTVEVKLMDLNIEYRCKRESERLGLLTAIWLKPGAGEAYKYFCVQQGQREGQFKTVALAYRREFHFDIEAHAEDIQS